jgi:Outer membrane protein beta-barrel domain
MKFTFKLLLATTLLLSVSLYSLSQKLSFETGYGYTTRLQGGRADIMDMGFNSNLLNANIHFELGKNWGLLTGIGYSFTYGNDWQGYANGYFVSRTTEAHFINIPVLATYSLPVSPTFKFFAFGGPKLNFGLSQIQYIGSNLPQLMTYGVKPTHQDTLNYNYAENIYNWYHTTLQLPSSGAFDLYSNTNATLSRFNLQASLGGGVQWGNTYMKGGYDFGLININLDRTSAYAWQGGWFVTVGYEFVDFKKLFESEKDE